MVQTAGVKHLSSSPLLWTSHSKKCLHLVPATRYMGNCKTGVWTWDCGRHCPEWGALLVTVICGEKCCSVSWRLSWRCGHTCDTNYKDPGFLQIVGRGEERDCVIACYVTRVQEMSQEKLDKVGEREAEMAAFVRELEGMELSCKEIGVEKDLLHK